MSEYRSPKIIPLSEDPAIRKRSPFWLFIGIWFSFLILAGVLFVGKFRQYLISYEAEYQASRPEHVAAEVADVFRSDDMASVYELQTAKPELSEFETEDNLFRYMDALIAGKEISYAKTNDYTEDAPEYFLTADRYIIGKFLLEKSTTEERKYKMPVWNIKELTFYTEAEHSVRISCPDTFVLKVNGVEVPDSYAYRRESAPGKEYFKDTIVLPEIKTYLIEELYEEPHVTAEKQDGTVIEPEMDTTLGMYQIPLSVSKDVEEEMLDFMTKAATTYTHYVANDASREATAVYFMPGMDTLKMVEYGETRKYYPWHRIQSEESEIIDFKPYDNDHFYCQLDIHQVLLLYGTQEKEVTTECRFYCIRTENGFKICGVEY